MREVRCELENRQAIVSIGLQKFIPHAGPFEAQGYPPSYPVNAYRALIDTGAQRTCISRTTILNEGLISHAKRQIQNVHSVQVHRLYWISLGFIYGTEYGPQESERSFYLLDTPIEVMNIADNDKFEAIIGMDVLERFDFRFEKGGKFILKL